MQRLLPITFKELLPHTVWNALTELSQFFRDLFSTSLQLKDIIQLEDNIAEILCKLEKIFPPSFFNSMHHLPIHLPYEARVGGPVQFTWMYPFERFLYHLKQKVGNKAQVEASKCNAYHTEEISNFYSHYFEENITTKMSSLGLNPGDDDETMDLELPDIFTCNDSYSASKGISVYLDNKDYDVGHRYILEDIWANYDHYFSSWFKGHVLDPGIDDDVIHSLALGPSTRVRKFNKYYINGFHFHTFNFGKNRSTVQYGVSVKGVEGNSYFGVLERIIEFVYIGSKRRYKRILFKCAWYDPGPQGTRMHINL